MTPVELKFGDENYVKLYHIKILAGRNIMPSDTGSGVVINEKYAKLLGFKNPGDAIGKVLGKNGDGEKSKRIVGVAGDFSTHSLQSPIGPLLILASGDKDNWQELQ